MKASRSFCFRPTKAISLALSCGFLCGQVVLANPDPSNPSTGDKAVAKQTAAAADSSAANSTEKAVEGEQISTTATLKAVEEPDKSKDDKGAAAANAKPGAIVSDEAALNQKDKPLSEEKLHDLGVLHWTLSKKYSKDGDLDLAQTELDLAVMNWPDMKVAHRDLCMLSLMRFNFMRSIAEFMMTVGLGDAQPLTEDESSKLVENAMTLHYKKGLVYARQQNWPKTVNELELAAHLISDDFAVERALAYAYGNLGRWDKAEQHYKNTFELSPQDGSSRADLAYFLQQNGKISEAQKEMEEAVKTQPKAAAYHVDLSCMAESHGDLDTASRELKEAVALSPSHADLWTHYGRVLARRGDTDQAINAYTKAISIDPSQADAKTALSELTAPAHRSTTIPADDSTPSKTL